MERTITKVSEEKDQVSVRTSLKMDRVEYMTLRSNVIKDHDNRASQINTLKDQLVKLVKETQIDQVWKSPDKWSFADFSGYLELALEAKERQNQIDSIREQVKEMEKTQETSQTVGGDTNKNILALS